MAGYLFEIGMSVANTTMSTADSIGSVTLSEVGYGTLGLASTVAATGIACNIIGTTAIGAAKGAKMLCKSISKGCPPNLKKYTINFSDQFRVQREKGNLYQKAYNRHKEVMEIEAKLSVRDNSAVFLHGPAGVGKTAVVEQIVYRQVTGQSKAFEGYEFLKLEHNKLFSLEKGIWTKIQDELFTNGTQGELSKIFDALKDKPYILFIDEADGVIETNFFQNKLEELARGQVKLIFATTTPQMLRCTHNWGPMMKRRIPLMEIKEFNLDQMIAALKEGRTEYEAMYGVTLDEEALSAIAALSTEIIDEKFPHKAVHLLGTMCSAIKASSKDKIPHITAQDVVNCYALIHDKEAVQLKKEIDKMILTLTPENIAPYFQKIKPAGIHYGPSVNSVFDKARVCFVSSLSTILVEPSKRVQGLLLQYFANERPVIPIRLSELSRIYNQLSPQNQKVFIQYFDELCAPSKEKSPVFFIQDSDNFLDLVTKKGGNSKAPSVAAYKNEIDKGVEVINDVLGSLNIKLPQASVLHNLFDPGTSVSSPINVNRTGSTVEALRGCPFIQHFIKKVCNKQTTVMATRIDGSSNLTFNDGGTTFRLQTMDPLQLDQMLDLLTKTYKDISPEVVSQTLTCTAFFFGRKLAVDMACHMLDAVREDTVSRPVDVIKQKFLEHGKEPAQVETVMHQHKFMQSQFASEIKCLQDEAAIHSPAVQEVLNDLSQTKTKMNFLTIEEGERLQFFKKMALQLPEGTYLYRFSTKELEECTLSKAFQQELILEKLEALNETIRARMSKSPVFVIDIPFAMQNDRIAAQIEKMVTVHGMKAVYFCSKEEIVVRKAESAPSTPTTILEKVVATAIGQIFKKEPEREENPYHYPNGLCIESRRILQINLDDKHYTKTRTLSARITHFFYSITLNPVKAVIGFGHRSIQAICSPFRQLNYSTAWISFSFLQSKK